MNIERSKSLHHHREAVTISHHGKYPGKSNLSQPCWRSMAGLLEIFLAPFSNAVSPSSTAAVRPNLKEVVAMLKRGSCSAGAVRYLAAAQYGHRDYAQQPANMRTFDQTYPSECASVLLDVVAPHDGIQEQRPREVQRVREELDDAKLDVGRAKCGPQAGEQ